MGFREDVEGCRVRRVALHARWSARTACVAQTPVPSANKAMRMGGESERTWAMPVYSTARKNALTCTEALLARKAAEGKRVDEGDEREEEKSRVWVVHTLTKLDFALLRSLAPKDR